VMKSAKQKRPSEQHFPITFQSVPAHPLHEAAKPCFAFRGLHYHVDARFEDRFFQGAARQQPQVRFAPRPTRSIVSRQLPLRSTATLAALPAMNHKCGSHLVPFAPLYLGSSRCARPLPARSRRRGIAHPIRSILLFPEPFEQFAQARGRLIAIQLACSYIEHQLLPSFAVRLRLNPIQS